MKRKTLFLFIVLIFILSPTANVFASSTITDTNSLGQYIYASMENYVSPITVNYANLSDINSTVRNNILSGAYLQDDYTAASFSDIAFKEKTDSANPSTVDLTITPTYVETSDQEAYVNKQVQQIVSSVVQPGMTDYQKVAALHDWVVSHVKYDTTLQDISDYSALADGKTVCRGYSMLLYKLLTNAGYNSHIVIGEVVTGFRYRHSATGHAWNMVQISGNWYFIDSTNDGLSTDTATKFFLVSGKVLQQNGFIWNQTKYPSAPINYGSTTSPVTISKNRITRLTYSTSPLTLSITATYSDGTRSVVPNSQATWASSNTDVATVDGNGVVTFTGNTGNVTIKATTGNLSSIAMTNVYYVLGMTKIKYSTTPQLIQMYKVYSNDITVALTGVTWASLDTSLATIDENGNLIFTGASGVATINGTYNGHTISEQVIVGNVSNNYMHWRFSRHW